MGHDEASYIVVHITWQKLISAEKLHDTLGKGEIVHRLKHASLAST